MSSVVSRRDLLTRAAALSIGAATSKLARADAAKTRAEEAEPLAHPVDPPPSLTFRTMTWPTSPFYGAPNSAVAAIPRDLPDGGRLPLVVLLPGGHHTMQPPDHGCWGWWNDYHLGDAETALRRGHVDKNDFQRMGRPTEIARINAMLAQERYRGAVLVTPWVIGRAAWPVPNGAMVVEFLRDLVMRARAELPVIPTRQATGLGGMSSGGLWTLYCGAACTDLFSTLVAIQPYTEDLVPILRARLAPLAKAMPPVRLRMITSDADHQRDTTVALSKALKEDAVPFEWVDSSGPHSAEFAAGPGVLDALLTFDRALRGESDDGTRPLPAHSEAMAPVSMGELNEPDGGALSPVATAPTGARSKGALVSIATGVALLGAIAQHVAQRKKAALTAQNPHDPDDDIAVTVEEEPRASSK